MSQAELQRFAADLQSNAALQQEIGNMTADPLHAVVSVAQRQGYDFTLEEARGVIEAKAQAKARRCPIPSSTGSRAASFRR